MDRIARPVEPRLHAERQAVPVGAQRIEQRREVPRAPAQHMQDRAEGLAIEGARIRHLEQRRRDETTGFDPALARQPVELCGVRQRRALAQARSRALHRLDVGAQSVGGGRGDHRADIGGEVGRVADDERLHGALEHLEHPIGDVVLQAQQPQRRAALAGAAERGVDGVVDDLLGQGRRIDDHGVDATGLRDQRQDRAVAGRERAVEPAPGGGRAGEHDARQSGVRERGLAELPTDHRQHRERILRDACCMQQVTESECDPGRGLGGLGDDGVARDERGHDLTGEDGEREVPRADAGPDAAGGHLQSVRLAGRTGERDRCALQAPSLGGVVAAEVGGFADLGDGVARGLAGLVREQRDEPTAVRFEGVGGALQACCALLGRAPRPRDEGLRGRSERGIYIGRSCEGRRRRERRGRRGAVTAQHIAQAAERGIATEVQAA